MPLYRVRVTKDSLVFSAGHFITFNGDQCERIPGTGQGAAGACLHNANTRSALVCISFFLVVSGMSSRSCARTSSATYS